MWNRYAASYQDQHFVRKVRHRCTHAAIYRHPETGEMEASFHVSEERAALARHAYWRDRSGPSRARYSWIPPCAVVPVSKEG